MSRGGARLRAWSHGFPVCAIQETLACEGRLRQQICISPLWETHRDPAGRHLDPAGHASRSCGTRISILRDASEPEPASSHLRHGLDGNSADLTNRSQDWMFASLNEPGL